MLGFQTYLDLVSGLNVYLLDIYNKKVCDFTSRKPIVLKLLTNMRLDKGVTVRVAIRTKNHAFGHNSTSRPTQNLFEGFKLIFYMHALSVESLTLVVAPILAELLHLTRLQGVF